MRTAVLGLVLATSSMATADPLTLSVGAGVRQQSLHGELRATPEADPMVDPTDVAPAVDVMAGYRILPGLAIGGRFGISKFDVQKKWGRSSDGELFDGYERTPLDFALVVQLEYSRLWLSPWAGVQAMYAVDQSRFESDFSDRMSASDLTADWSSSLSYGATGGVDVLKRRSDRMTVFAGAQTGTGGYSAVTFGLGYRR
jgi:hypothetical protein